MKLVNIFFQRIMFDGEEFPYSENQDFVNQIKDDELILEFDDYIDYIELTNVSLEYALKYKRTYRKKNIISINSQKKLLQKYQLLNEELEKIIFLGVSNGKEVTFETLNPNCDIIGIKYIFSNNKCFYVYSAEPEMISEKEFHVFRESSVMSLIIPNKKISSKEKSKFPLIYQLAGNASD